MTAAEQVVERCRVLAGYTEEPGFITRTFLSGPMRGVHAQVRTWMEAAGLTVRIDPAGNIRGSYAALPVGAPVFYIGSHLDTVPRAGAFDGILGVMAGIALIEMLDGRRLKCAIEVIGFSEEEGVRFAAPFIGSRALAGTLDSDLLDRRDANGVSVAEAICGYGLDPSQIPGATADNPLGYLELHIEQGPVLESLLLPLGLVETIVGQSRLNLLFEGQANHAGTTPMHLRRDALAGAAEWIGIVEREAQATPGLVATVGRITAQPGAGNVIAGSVEVSLDVRHAQDSTRHHIVEGLLNCAQQIATRRGLACSHEVGMDQPAVAMDAQLSLALEHALASEQHVHRMPSGAGHDAMVLAARMPTAMLFVRSPGGISHHPEEAVLVEDVAAALRVGLRFLETLESQHA